MITSYNKAQALVLNSGKKVVFRVGSVVRLKCGKYTRLYILFLLLLIFQSPLEMVSSVFKLIDEVIAASAIALYLKRRAVVGFKVSKRYIGFLIALLSFIAVGLFGNLIYKYQSCQVVLVDLFTNLKFFLAILTGYYIFREDTLKKFSYAANITARATTIFFVFLMFIDRFVFSFGGQVRYGIRSLQLIYAHSTYLSAALAFMMVLLFAFYKPGNMYYIVLDAVMMVFTLRSKAFASVGVFFLLYYFLKKKRKKKLKLWHIIVAGGLALYLGWNNLRFYYYQITESARKVITDTSFRIMRDYFPIGTGFGTYASHSANSNYSPVYQIYDFSRYVELGPNSGFLDDTFWPIIIGQTGFLGTVFYVTLLFLIFKKLLTLKDQNMYICAIFVFAYLLISSSSEPVFNNSVSIAFAFIIGVFTKHNEMKYSKQRGAG